LRPIYAHAFSSATALTHVTITGTANVAGKAKL